MSSTALEQLRSAFEDIESYERHVVHTLSEKTRNVCLYILNVIEIPNDPSLFYPSIVNESFKDIK